ncbi:phosphodiesterase [Xanthobacter tagetidis]|uniref:Phosphodiesterase n=1 Tax=Xanthobacter tagetidis TaxID=60216 RepID=A0A3L7A4J3_9HYPH|nr:phosphodiesterase [Xanthobacter tagetidis]MBB6310033.1 3',5'-cyclic AMP phosphodiesterase CpdA [Xanthobacter tagetidis]RLP75137.1 phosphodiesterase [Xanthobacter tagetidis]
MLIAQLTDFHVTLPGQTAGGVDTRAAFAALVERVRALAPRPELLLVSGDLAEAGVDAEYAFVLEGLESLGIPFLAVPGNHDAPAPLRRVLARHTGTEPEHGGLVHEQGGLRVIGLDTLVEGASHGALPPAQIAWLKGVLGAGDGLPTLIFMHHPPFATGLPAMDEIGIREGRDALSDLLAGRRDILGLVCGHVHRAISGSFAGHRAFIAPSASHQFALDFAGPGFRVVREPTQIALHRVADGRLVSYLVPGPPL